MILYNVTVSIDESIESEWLTWMKDIHIPEVMETGCFKENKICRILAEEEGGKAYSIQYFAPDMETYIRYQTEFAPELQKSHSTKYAGRFAAFRTLLEVVHASEQLGN
jgi:hypothetical protein